MPLSPSHHPAALAAVAAEKLAIDHTAQHPSPRQSHHKQRQSRKSAEVDSPTKSSSNCPNQGPSPNSSDDDDNSVAAETGSRTGSDDADEEEEDDSDAGAVKAPSDHDAMDQAGHTILLESQLNQIESNISLQLETGSGRGSELPLTSSPHRRYQQPYSNREMCIQEFEKDVRIAAERREAEGLTYNAVAAEIAFGQDEDDDDCYNYVDDISESDGEDPSKREEQLMLNDIRDEMFLQEVPDRVSMLTDGMYFPDQDEQLSHIQYTARNDNLWSNDFDSASDGIPPMTSPPPPTPPTIARRVHFETSTFATDVPAFDGSLSYLPTSWKPDDQSSSSSASPSLYDAGGETTDTEAIPLTVTKSPRDLFRPPSGNEEPTSSRSPARTKRNMRRSRIGKRRGPRLAIWAVDPQTKLAQGYFGKKDDGRKEDEENERGQKEIKGKGKEKERGGDQEKEQWLVTVMPPTFGPRRPCRSHSRPKSSCINACIYKEKRNSELEERQSTAHAIDTPDPTVGTGTNATMVNMMMDLTGKDGASGHKNIFQNSDFVPAQYARSVVRELQFNAANSDHSSTDADIMDYLNFDDDSSEYGSDAKCLRLENRNVEQHISEDILTEDNDIELLELPTDVVVPLMTPASSQSQSPTTANEALSKPLSGNFRRGIPPSQSRPPSWRPRSGLALTKPTIRGNKEHAINAPVGRKRKLSESFAPADHHHNTRIRR